MRRGLGGSLYGKLMYMTVLPMVMLAIVICTFCVRKYTDVVYDEVLAGLRNTCEMLLQNYDLFYPGDYTLSTEGKAIFKKGDHILNGDYSVLDQYKRETDMDISLLYHDTRILSTVKDKAGNRIVGTKCSPIVMQDVYETGQEKFYPKMDVYGQDYFSYYKPIFSSDGSCVGMIFAGKPCASVEQAIDDAVLPAVLIAVAATCLAVLFSIYFTGEMVRDIKSMQRYMEAVSNGDSFEEMDHRILKRGDELGAMGNTIVQTQRALRELVEKDALTGLNNRRYGSLNLSEIQQKAKASGSSFSVVIGDIDFFKKVNDTMGHDCGDEVLKAVADILRRYMEGRGFASRWGGEEFLLVFRDIHEDQARVEVEELLQQIRDLKVSYGEQTVQVTMSFGVTEGSTSGHIDQIVKAADDKLYYAKKNGRNRVVVRMGEDQDTERTDTAVCLHGEKENEME